MDFSSDRNPSFWMASALWSFSLDEHRLAPSDFKGCQDVCKKKKRRHLCIAANNHRISTSGNRLYLPLYCHDLDLSRSFGTLHRWTGVSWFQTGFYPVNRRLLSHSKESSSWNSCFSHERPDHGAVDCVATNWISEAFRGPSRWTPWPNPAGWDYWVTKRIRKYHIMRLQQHRTVLPWPLQMQWSLQCSNILSLRVQVRRYSRLARNCRDRFLRDASNIRNSFVSSRLWDETLCLSTQVRILFKFFGTSGGIQVFR